MTYEFRSHAPRDLISLAALIIAAILVLHIIFVWLNANPGNDIVSTDADWAGWLATWFVDLFTPANAKLRTFLNYGLAALFFLAIGGILRRVLRDV
ncbi:hypothetical protein KGQ20_25720 [Catenulispora sp. NF23]|uniref:Uncharacterized protein n=1 Tax=Catenulispora pinistramenti TaxID=2705254 RepID=A0ABS5L1M0_9ACTN|nr:hypothetical protein [Catenulispora pinistramenti]MBS2536167.1 hypothetical protein [Catenulispora pinistramenti]MBS2552089.1 hypothetical protein [Catenulispora pinistramenti]